MVKMVKSTTVSVRGCPQPRQLPQDKNGNRTFLKGRRKNYILVVIILAIISSIILFAFYEQPLTVGRTKRKFFSESNYAISLTLIIQGRAYIVITLPSK